MQKALLELINISKTLGRNHDLVLGAFGNISVKTADSRIMYIKASGVALKDLAPSRGYRRLDVARTCAILSDTSISALAPDKRGSRVWAALSCACEDDICESVKPSIESCFHAILDKYVIHLHPAAVLSIVCAKNGKAVIDKIFKNEKHPPLWVPYSHLGYSLAKRIRRLSADYEKQYSRPPQIIFLQNHGLLISTSAAQKGIALVKQTVSACKAALKTPRAVKIRQPAAPDVVSACLAVRSAVFAVSGRYTMVKHHFDKDIASFLRRPDAARLLAAPAVSPDEWYFCNGGPLWVDAADKDKIAKQLQKRLAAGLPLPTAFLVKNTGLFLLAEGKDPALLFDFVKSFLAVRASAAAFGGVLSISKSDRTLIEIPQPRTNLPLEGKIAVVTGAGSGLGRHIAIGLAHAGASVALADIDTAASQQTAKIITDILPLCRTLTLGCDVTSESSVVSAFDGLLDCFGGLDILVNAAGIAPPFALTDLPVEKWRLALEINLTGYFLMAKHAAGIMIAQSIGGSIVNLSSKSGLEPSKNNTPYNATKAGEIHIARGWALELGSHNIRVNSVCPGNVFEGSKIWNPRYIKVCAKKYGIKPEDVIPYYVSKTALNKEIKGSDVADTVVFLCSEKARMITGQTIVTDAGQVMVR